MSLKTQMINMNLFLQKLFSRDGGSRYDQNILYVCIKFQRINKKNIFKSYFPSEPGQLGGSKRIPTKYIWQSWSLDPLRRRSIQS